MNKPVFCGRGYGGKYKNARSGLFLSTKSQQWPTRFVEKLEIPISQHRSSGPAKRVKKRGFQRGAVRAVLAGRCKVGESQAAAIERVLSDKAVAAGKSCYAGPRRIEVQIRPFAGRDRSIPFGHQDPLVFRKTSGLSGQICSTR